MAQNGTSGKRRPHRISAAVENAREIALLASPARIEIVDTLEALGEAVTVAELAARLGRPADGLYYHLRQLADGGLIEEQLDLSDQLSSPNKLTEALAGHTPALCTDLVEARRMLGDLAETWVLKDANQLESSLQAGECGPNVLDLSTGRGAALDFSVQRNAKPSTRCN